MRWTQDRALTVSELNEYARLLLAGDPLLRNVEVTGEISGYKRHYSGHRYFTLKDSAARIQCVMFRQDALNLEFEPADGQKVVASGSASLFVRDGSYQLYVHHMRKSGRGDLYEQLERIRERLLREGLFDPARKRAIPAFPRRIGVATSKTGAAVHDIIRVAKRRNPNIEILLAPCMVQGEYAAEDIARAVRILNEEGSCDVLLVGRGGGSIEDLWAFNEEIVVRAIAESRIPVISCVGHEVDTTLSDYAADLRAATPSAAAELAVPVWENAIAQVEDLTRRLASALEEGQKRRYDLLDRVVRRPSMENPLQVLVEARAEKLKGISAQLYKSFAANQTARLHRLDNAFGRMNALNPKGVIKRGYAYVEKNGHVVTDTAETMLGERYRVHMRDGVLGVEVLSIEGETYGKEKAHV